MGWVEKWRTAEVQNNRLVVVPGSGGWFEDMVGGHMYRPITGNFLVTTRVRVSGTQSALPRTSFSLAGLLIRAPREFNVGNWTPGKENWLFFSVGTAADVEQLPEKLAVTGRPQCEIKSTVQSKSTLKISEAPSAYVNLRIVRDGSIFTMLFRPVASGAEWKVLDQFLRPDLPETLHVGITAYSDWDSAAAVYPDYERLNRVGPPTSNADLRAEFEFIRFRRPAFNLGLPIASLVSRRMADYTRD